MAFTEKSSHTTIAAIATPGGSGGIGIVRLSGPRAVEIAETLFLPANSNSPCTDPHAESDERSFESHRIYYGHIIDRPSGEIIDEVLLSVMKAPRSYTREDVVEISAHGGQVVLHSVLELVIKNGARLAEPGEFTRRAFINGRIDLTQAEAVIDLINARSKSARQLAVKQIGGNLRSELEKIRSAVLDLAARIEAWIDFPEDFEEEIDFRELSRELSDKVVLPLDTLVRNYRDAKFLRDGITALIVGRPNVGKSSLLNRLVNSERAIVTDVPGTTRDFILEPFQINGLSVNLIDTAGLQDTIDPIETLGIQKTRELIQKADVILLVIDASLPPCDEEQGIFAMLKDKTVILVLNKSDLVPCQRRGPLPGGWDANLLLNVSAKTGENIDTLRNMIQNACVSRRDGYLEEEIVPNLRQFKRLEYALESARRAFSGIEKGLPADLVSVDLKWSLEAIDDCIGFNVREDILDEIFSRFCIGK